MKLMIPELYDALRESAGEEKARAAATAVANFQEQIHNLRSELRVLRWITATTAGGVILLIGMVLQVLLQINVILHAR